MSHGFEIAPTGRSKCRGCSESIAKGDVRFGEVIPNPYAEGETTLWFHPQCGAYTRPEPFLEAIAEPPAAEFDLDLASLERDARLGAEHRRLPRLTSAMRSPSGRAKCRCCREAIAKDDWRFGLLYYEDGRFEASGYVHASCSEEYFGTADVVARARYFSALSEPDCAELSAALAG